MWNPTHVQFTVLRARNLISKGKSGNNDVFVTIHVGKQRFQTSTIKNTHNPEWFEECELELPTLHHDIEVTVYHRSILQDDFLGYCSIPLSDYKVYDSPKSQWVSLGARPKKPDNKYRGEVEVRLTFQVKSIANGGDGLRRKRSSSFRSVASAVGDKLKFIRSSSFREKSMMSPNGTGSSLSLRHSVAEQPVNRNGAAFSQNDDRNTLPGYDRSPRHQQFPACDDARTDNQSGEMRLRRTMSTPIYKVGTARPRIQMGSANIKPEALEARLRSITLAGIREETTEKEKPEIKASADILSSSVPVGPSYLEEPCSPVRPFQPTYAAIVKQNGLSNDRADTKLQSAEDVSGGFEDYVKRGRLHRVSPAFSPQHNSASDSDEADSSSKSANQKEGSTSSIPTVVRRRSKGDKKIQLMRNAEMMGRRYTVQGTDFRARPSMFMYEEMFTNSRGEFRRSYHDPLSRNPDATDLVTMYRGMTKEELIKLVTTYKAQLIRKDQYIKDLELYIDDLIVRVMENTPRILSKADPRFH